MTALPVPSPGDFPDPGIEPAPLTLQADSLLLSKQGGPTSHVLYSFIPQLPYNVHFLKIEA